MAVQRDIRETGIFREVEDFAASAVGVGTGRPFDLFDLAVSPDGRTLAASGVVLDQLVGLPEQRIFLIDIESGAMHAATEGPARDRLPRWSRDGSRLAYLSDATAPFDFQLRILTSATGEIAAVNLPGHWVESFQWSPSGTRILLQAAGQGAGLAGAQGAIAAPVASSEGPDWAPEIDAGEPDAQWRTLWIYDVASGELDCISPPGTTAWEACWCGEDHVACIASDDPTEDGWYHASVRKIDIGRRSSQTLYVPFDQLGFLSASPSGDRVAFVEAFCSDRLLVAGTLVVGSADGLARMDTKGTDVTFTAWQGEAGLLFAGMRGFETVVAQIDTGSGAIEELWVSDERTCGGPLLPDVAPGPDVGTVLFVAEGHLVPPQLLKVDKAGGERLVAEVPSAAPDHACPAARMERLEWLAPDGLMIQGWLMRPATEGPHPLVLDIHGGPVWRYRPRYAGRGGYAGSLLRHGYAVLQANPRGSSGQGQAFARHVAGDAGGADAADLLAGIDAVVARGIADPARLGVVGGSYGGYMTAWLITQDTRFAAAVPIAPVSDWISGHLTNHSAFTIKMLVGADKVTPDSHFFSRSPVMYADRVRTPTMTICGALDTSTPPSQGVEFHHALSAAGVRSALLTYPGEGHGVKKYPAVLDFVSRILIWFDEHMPVEATRGL